MRPSCCLGRPHCICDYFQKNPPQPKNDCGGISGIYYDLHLFDEDERPWGQFALYAELTVGVGAYDFVECGL